MLCITELKHLELQEICPRLPLPLYVPLDGLSIRCSRSHHRLMYPSVKIILPYSTRLTAVFRRMISRALMLLKFCTIHPGVMFG